MQLCRSFKIRGAVNSYMKLTKANKTKGNKNKITFL